jgi:hypothetical protein
MVNPDAKVCQTRLGQLYPHITAIHELYATGAHDRLFQKSDQEAWLRSLAGLVQMLNHAGGMS